MRTIATKLILIDTTVISSILEFPNVTYDADRLFKLAPRSILFVDLRLRSAMVEGWGFALLRVPPHLPQTNDVDRQRMTCQ